MSSLEERYEMVAKIKAAIIELSRGATNEEMSAIGCMLMHESIIHVGSVAVVNGRTLQEIADMACETVQKLCAAAPPTLQAMSEANLRARTTEITNKA
jgi:hypothetical protein